MTAEWEREMDVGSRELFATAPVPMAMAGPAWEIRAANAALEALLGVGPGALAATALADRLPPADAAALAAVTPAEEVRLPLRLRGADGGEVAVELVACPVGGGAGWLLWLHDVTPQRRREAELVAEEARLRRLVEQVPGVLWRTDRALRFVFVRGGELAHWFTDSAGKAVADVDAEDAPRALAAHRRALAGESVRYEMRFRDRVFDARVEPYRDGEGVSGVVGVAVDVTAARQAAHEAALRGALLEQLFRTAPEAIVLVDRHERVVRVNAEFTRIFGHPATEVVGRSLGELLAPDDLRAGQRAILARVVAGETVRAEAVRQRRDGRRIDVSILATPVDVDGERVGVYAIYRDITEERRAATVLAGAEAHYRRLVETSPYGIFATDGAARLVEVNEALARILGAPVGALLGRSFADVLAPESRQAPLAEFGRRMSGQERGVYEADLEVLRPGGERRVVEVRSAPIVEDDRVTGVHGVVRDVTDERARAVHLRRVERLAAVGTLIGGVAHELNNPLSAIRGFAQLLLMDPRGDDDREALEMMQREADRAAKVVADLRLLARDTQGGGERGAVDLNEVVRHVLRLRAYALATHNVAVHAELEPGLPAVRGDRAELEQVLLNLVVNAEHALQGVAERALRVRTAAVAHGVRVEVRDSGPGIAPEHLERVFDAFWTTKPPGEGTGLGLSLVHSIVAEHGGVVHVDSAPGAGAAFVVELARAGGSAGAPPAGAPLPPPRRLLRVLVVDDEVAVRRTIARALGGRGHQVVEAGDGAEALRRVDEGAPFDAVVADLRMPGLGGDRLLEALAERGGGGERRLFFVTGDAVSPQAARFLARAALPVLEKPFDLAVLVARVEAHADAAAPP